MRRNKHDVKETTRRQTHILQMLASDFPCRVVLTPRQTDRAVCCGGSARARQTEAAIPVILSWVLAQAEQRPVPLEGPPVRPARSWRVPNLCVHLGLPAEQRRGEVRTIYGPKERQLHQLILSVGKVQIRHELVQSSVHQFLNELVQVIVHDSKILN